MPQLFDVPGWKVSEDPVAESSQGSASKKRKRPASNGSSLLAGGFSLEKLMDTIKEKTADLPAAKGEKPKKKKSKEKDKGKEKEKSKQEDKSKPAAVVERKISRPMPLQRGSEKRSVKNSPAKPEVLRPPKRQKTQHEDEEEAPSQHTPAADTATEENYTTLQKSMKDKLDGARFRMINENLYKSESGDAVQMMKEDPSVFSEYHKGFRRQVQTWPTNPVDLYIEQLQDYPEKTVVADIGCGDAALARALIPQGMVVMSFDLVADGAFVIEADACQKIPLPGSEGGDSGPSVGEAQVVDVVVCALSLMNTNWPRCIREAWRVLKANGELKIAEVASRFSSIKEFESLVCSIGFKLKSKDDSNSHFTLFEFKKIPRSLKTEKDWANIYGKGSVLKPCEYKRR
ncbi:ribosomal RNA-processing protein 8 [Coprinopsis sp. MPI-PUGE-AT-0042]|nr:ribosomal RNA-processing protein 8 [Coprinopsis sp. MPI-PUGE-AT-0042]